MLTFWRHCTRPVCGRSPNRARNRTVLPAPLGPITAKASPCFSVKETFWRTGWPSSVTPRSSTVRTMSSVMRAWNKRIMRASAMHWFQRKDVPFCLVGAAVVTTLISIRVFESLMAVALVALIVTRQKWQLPPVWLPLSLFLLGTLVSLGASGHVREGLPQVRKFYVYIILFLVTSAVRTVREIRWI